MKVANSTFLLLLFALCLSGCTPAQQTPSAAVKKTEANLTGTRWQLIRVKDSNLTPPRQAHLIFEGGKTPRILGSAGCNRFSAPYSIRENTIRFGTLLSTRMICPDMQTERFFFDHMRNVNRFAIRNRTLRLKENAVVLLEFNATSAP